MDHYFDSAVADFVKKDFSDIGVDVRKLRKNITEMTKEAYHDAKPETCVLCKVPGKKFCNSHTIPQFVLRTIAQDGKLLYWNAILKSPVVDTEKGMKQAETFKIICTECDKKEFAEYENPSNYDGPVTQKMMQEITLKNLLNPYAKAIKDKKLYTNLLNASENLLDPPFLNLMFEPLPVAQIKEKIKATKTDIKDYTRQIHILYHGKPDQYDVIWEYKLNYAVPIAFQGEINLVTGFNHELINNIYDYNEKNKLKPIELCVFPFLNQTHILLFLAKRDRHLYRKFIKKFSKIDVSEKLKVILLIIFLYSDTFLVSPLLAEEVSKNPKVQKTFSILPDFAGGIPHGVEDVSMYVSQQAVKEYDLNSYQDVPDFLSEQYSIEHLKADDTENL